MVGAGANNNEVVDQTWTEVLSHDIHWHLLLGSRAQFEQTLLGVCSDILKFLKVQVYR